MFKPQTALALLALAALGAQAQQNRVDTIRPDAPALAPYGKYNVGVQTLRLVHAGQVDVLNAKAGQPNPVYDRPLTVEVWYPANLNGRAPGGEYTVVTRDPKVEATLTGRAVRDAAPDPSGGPYPLIIISHGYPGNRYLLSDLGENLASKGYVTVSIDHTDSTYSDQGAFASTLLNRPLDQLFVLDEMARLNGEDGFLKGLVNADDTGLIGYSMGAYGAVNVIGGGFTAQSVKLPFAPPGDLLARRQAGNPEYRASLDGRIKAAIAIAPWGWNAGFWDAAGLAGVKTPVLFMAGSVDDVAGYSPGVRNIFEGAVNADRYLLTFQNANHNAAAPIPAPLETWQPGPTAGLNPFEHYADPVWDTARMNNVAEHFATAFFGEYLKKDPAMRDYLNLTENSSDGKYSVDKDGQPLPDFTYWKGFPNRTAVGLRLEHLRP